MSIEEILQRFDEDQFSWNLKRVDYERIEKELEEME
jgi:hypothetical protein